MTGRFVGGIQRVSGAAGGRFVICCPRRLGGGLCLPQRRFALLQSGALSLHAGQSGFLRQRTGGFCQPCHPLCRRLRGIAGFGVFLRGFLPLQLLP